MVTSRQAAVGSPRTRPFVGEWEREYPFEDHWLDLGEVRMHYVDESSTFGVRRSALTTDQPRTPNPEHRTVPLQLRTPNTEHRTLLFLHGNPTWSFYWRHLIARFRDTHRCVAPDHIGCGMSDKPQHYPYTLARHIDNTVALAHALDLRNIVLCVHDWGGAIGMGVAARIPDRVRGFVVCNTAAFPFDRMPLSIGLCRIPGFGALAIRGFNAFVRGALARCARKPLTADAKAGYLAPYSSWEDRVANLRFVQDIPMDASHESWKTLAEVEVALPSFMDHPMLLCWGGKDFVFTEAFLHEWQRRFPNAQTQLYPEAGHFVVEDARAAIIEAMEDFLPKVPAA